MIKLKHANALKKLVLCTMLFTATTPLLTGCWDRLEIEERIFVLAVAIDKVEQKQTVFPYYEVTVQLAEPRALSGQAPSDNMKPIWNVTTTGPSMFDCMRELTTKVARVPFYEHLQVIVVSEELARDGLARPMDLFLRDHEMRRRISLVVTEGKAKEALGIDHRLVPVPGLYLSMLTKESLRKTALMPRDSTVGHFSTNYRAGQHTLLNRIVPDRNSVHMKGGAVLKQDRFVGWLSDMEVRAFRWVRGTVAAGNYVIVKGKDKARNYTSYEVKSMRSIIKASVRDGKPKFSVTIRSEGHIGEDGLPPNPTSGDLIEAERYLNKQIKKDTQAIVKKMQTKFGIDLFGFGEQMRRYEYAYWKKHKDRWDDIFRTAEVDIRVETSIRRIGHVR